MNIPIAFADSIYTNQDISSNSIPFGDDFVASYAGKKIGDKIETELFKYLNDFINYLENKRPKIVCFINYSWTIDISHEFSKRIKNKFPETIIVFDGPNYL
jgi:hypothetical protein|tara:strand:+ start:2682 stop:2984 length:303 start_codon:yes stop_codon:yes gene_type:complete